MEEMPVVEVEIGNRFNHMPVAFKEHKQTADECIFILEVQKALADGEPSEIMPSIMYEVDTVLAMPVQEEPEEEDEMTEDGTFEML